MLVSQGTILSLASFKGLLGFSPNLWLLGMLVDKHLFLMGEPVSALWTLQCHRLTVTGTGALFCPRVLNCLFPDSTCVCLSSLFAVSPNILPGITNNLVPLCTESHYRSLFSIDLRSS